MPACNDGGPEASQPFASSISIPINLQAVPMMVVERSNFDFQAGNIE
jgi:hypothetical protein